MTLAFTICSVNYLAQARTLGDSLRQTNPDWQYVIGLVDRLDAANLPPALTPDYEMVEVHTIGIPDLDGMGNRYDITELNTAVKPFFIDYFFNTRPDATAVIYFDPDIIVFQPLTRLRASLDNHSLVLTPHICTPTPDWLRPNEQHHLNTGIFNLGFIGLRHDDTARRFVNWWKERLVYECRIDLAAGLFVDQQWVNFAPVYYDNVFVEKHLGYNVAYWNMHERRTNFRDGQWWINDEFPLQFFHYSGYSPAKPYDVSKYQDRYTFSPEGTAPADQQLTDRADIWPLFALYRDRLLANQNEIYRTYRCVYIKQPPILLLTSVRRAINQPMRWLLKQITSPLAH
jgi:hypothetical protein